MLGVFPIIPCVYAPTFHVPISSPKIARMLGFLSAASADTITANATRANAVSCARRSVYVNQHRRTLPGSDRVCWCIISWVGLCLVMGERIRRKGMGPRFILITSLFFVAQGVPELYHQRPGPSRSQNGSSPARPTIQFAEAGGGLADSSRLQHFFPRDSRCTKCHNHFRVEEPAGCKPRVARHELPWENRL
jgi:hypothetical protein